LKGVITQGVANENEKTAQEAANQLDEMSKRLKDVKRGLQPSVSLKASDLKTPGIGSDSYESSLRQLDELGKDADNRAKLIRASIDKTKERLK